MLHVQLYAHQGFLSNVNVSYERKDRNGIAGSLGDPRRLATSLVGKSIILYWIYFISKPRSGMEQGDP